MFIVDTANLLLFIKTTKYLPPFTNLPPFIVGVFSYLLSLIDNKNRPFYLKSHNGLHGVKLCNFKIFLLINSSRKYEDTIILRKQIPPSPNNSRVLQI